MNDLADNRLRFSSTKRLSSKVQPPPALRVFTQKERIDWVLNAVQNVCFKLERCLDNQNRKIKNLEASFSTVLQQKLDKLIEANKDIAKAIEKHNQKNDFKFFPYNPILEKKILQKRQNDVKIEEGESEDEVNQGTIESKQISKEASFPSGSVLKTESLIHITAPQSTTPQQPAPPIIKPISIKIQPPQIQRSLQVPIIREQHLLNMDSPIPPSLRKRFYLSPTIITTNSQQLLRRNAESSMQPFASPQTTTIVIQKPIFDRETFMSQIVLKLRDFHNLTAQQMYNIYSSGKINYRDMKIQYSWRVMNFYFDINNQIIRGPAELLETLGSRMTISKTIDETTRDILQFLIKKYPPSRNKIIDTELANHIKEFSRQSDLTYDIFRNAGMSFVDDTGKRNFTKQIKVWLNMLISHTKIMFPEFKRLIKSIFIDGDNNSLNGDEESQVQYQINSKISQNTPLYTEEELDMPGLNLKAPELLRILVKWAEELLCYFEKTQEKIIQNKSGFKSVTRGIGISLTLKRKQNLARTLKEIYRDDIQKRSANRSRHMYNIMNQLFTMAFEGYKGFQYLDERQLLIVKISQFFSECASTYTEKMLNNMIAGLNTLRLKYKNELLESSLDLVTFGVLDIMRCKCVGSKQQILRIYRQLGERKDFEIIRVKNKLNESTRDILINFKHRDSFLICEMQLALGDSKDDVNDHFSHYLYEMRRSAFPVPFENASQLVNFDPRTSYFDKHRLVEFKPNPQFDRSKPTITVKDFRVFCIKHQQQEMIFHSNSAPFCCSYCSRFVKTHTYSIQYLRCYRCMACICPKCLLDRCPDFQTTYLNRHERVAEVSEFMRSEPYFAGFCKNGELDSHILKALNQEASRVLVHQFDKQGLKTNVYKLCDGKKVNAFSTIQAITSQWVCDSSNNWNLIWIPYKIQTHRISDLKLYKKQSFYKEYPENILRRVLGENEQVIFAMHSEEKKALILDIEEDRNKIESQLLRTEMIKHIKNENKKTKLNLELTTKQLTNLSILKRVTRKSEVHSLNLWENNLVNIDQLKDFVGIQDLNLRQNKIDSIREVQYMTNLQYLDVHKNNLTGKLPQLDLPYLRTLDLSLNQLKDLSSLSEASLPCLSVFFISHNHLTELPILICPALEVYFFSHNRIQNLENLALSRIPKVRRLYGFNNWISGELPDFNFPCLEYMLLEENRIEGINILSKWRMNTLQNIVLSKNSISGPFPVFNLPGLKRLDLNQNRISDITQLNQCQLSRIEEMDLSSNAIEGSIPILPFPSIKRLDISYNKINSIANLEHSPLKSIETLILSNNSIDKLVPLSFQNIHFINLSDNVIKNIEVMAQWSLPQVQIIKLENNSIQGNVPTLFLNNLLELYLDGNDLSDLHFLAEMQLLPKLRIISIKGNKSKDIQVTLQLKSHKSYHRALSGVWKSKILPADYAGGDD